jgi:glycosyltransferase involved in cell wall biosynthesis
MLWSFAVPLSQPAPGEPAASRISLPAAGDMALHRVTPSERSGVRHSSPGVYPGPAVTRPAGTGRRAPSQSERKVLLVAPEPFYEDRGTPIAVRNVIGALSELGYGIDLLTYPIGQSVEVNGLRILRSPNPFRIRQVPVGLSLKKILLDVTLVPALWLRLRRERYYCIHAVEEAAFPAVILGSWFDVPVIYDMQSSLPQQLVKYRMLRGRIVQALLQRCESWLLRRADAVVSSAGLLHKVFRTSPGKLAREWHFPSSPAAPVDGAQDSLRSRLNIPADAPVVLYAGTFEPYQGLSILLAAAQRVLAVVPRAVFVLVGGEGEPAEEVRREVMRLDLTDRVRLLGRKPRDEISAFLAMADLLVSPRCYGDNLPLKVFDYLAAGRPIVATDLPAHRAVLDERCAVLTEPTASGLADGIAGLLGDPARAEQLASAARAYSETELGWKGFVTTVNGIYKEVGCHSASATE